MQPDLGFAGKRAKHKGLGSTREDGLKIKL